MTHSAKAGAANAETTAAATANDLSIEFPPVFVFVTLAAKQHVKLKHYPGSKGCPQRYWIEYTRPVHIPEILDVLRCRVYRSGPRGRLVNHEERSLFRTHAYA